MALLPLERYRIGNPVPTTIVPNTQRGWIYIPRVASVSDVMRRSFLDDTGLGYHLLWTPKSACDEEAYEGTDWPDHQVRNVDDVDSTPLVAALPNPSFHFDFGTWYSPGPGTLSVVGGDPSSDIEIEIAVLARRLRSAETPPPWRLTFPVAAQTIQLLGPNGYRGIVAVELAANSTTDNNPHTGVVRVGYGGNPVRRTLVMGMPLKLTGAQFVEPDSDNIALTFHLEL